MTRKTLLTLALSLPLAGLLPRRAESRVYAEDDVLAVEDVLDVPKFNGVPKDTDVCVTSCDVNCSSHGKFSMVSASALIGGEWVPLIQMPDGSFSMPSGSLTVR